jgi:hypothetical protein
MAATDQSGEISPIYPEPDGVVGPHAARHQPRRRGVAHAASLVASGDDPAEPRRAQHPTRRRSAVRGA